MKENEIVYQIKITFQDILDNSPQYVRDFYENLNKEEREKFIEANLHSASKGAEYGLSEPIYDVISTIGQNLEFEDNEILTVLKQIDMNHHKAITSRLNSLVGVTKPKGKNTFKKRATATNNKVIN